MSYWLPEVEFCSCINTLSIILGNNLSIGMNNYGILIAMVDLIMSTLIAVAGQTKFFAVLSQKDSW